MLKTTGEDSIRESTPSYELQIPSVPETEFNYLKSSSHLPQGDSKCSKTINKTSSVEEVHPHS